MREAIQMGSLLRQLDDHIACSAEFIQKTAFGAAEGGRGFGAGGGGQGGQGDEMLGLGMMEFQPY